MKVVLSLALLLASGLSFAQLSAIKDLKVEELQKGTEFKLVKDITIPQGMSYIYINADQIKITKITDNKVRNTEKPYCVFLNEKYETFKELTVLKAGLAWEVHSTDIDDINFSFLSGDVSEVILRRVGKKSGLMMRCAQYDGYHYDRLSIGEMAKTLEDYFLVTPPPAKVIK